MQGIKPEREGGTPPHSPALPWASPPPTLHLLELEVLLSRQLRAAVRGARGLGLAVSFPEITSIHSPK